MKTQNISHILIYILCTAIFSACVKDHFDLKEKLSDEIRWNPHIALPLAHANLTLGDIVKEKKDTIQHIKETDLGYGNVSEDLVIQLRYGIDTARKIDIMRLPIMEPYDTTIYLEPLKLHNVQTSVSKKVKDLVADNFSAPDNTTYQSYEALGTPVNTTEISAINSTIYNANNLPFTIIEYALLTEGTMSVTCKNNFSVPFMTDLVLYTDSAGITKEFATFEFSKGGTQWIMPGGSATEIFICNNTYLGSTLKYQYVNMKFASASNVTIDLSETIETDIELTDLIASEGKAVVPEQTIKMDSTVYLTLRDIDASKKLYNIIIEKGLINYKINSSIEVATHFIVDFLSMEYNNQPVTKEAELNKNNPIKIDNWSLANHEVDLTQNPEQPYNSVPIKLGYRVHTGNQLIAFGPSHNIKIEITNPDSIFFAFLEGNLGKVQENVFTDNIDFQIENFIKNFFSGEITFYDPKLRIVYDNPVGIPGSFELNMIGKNSDGKSINMFQGHNNKFKILAPNCDSVRQGLGIVSTIELNKTSSNIVDFIKLLPNSIEYSGVFYANEQATNEDNILNCVSNKGDAKLTVEAELPMKLSLKDLVIKQEIVLSEIPNIENIESIESLRLFFYTENQFPLDVKLKITMLDTTAVNQELGVLDIIVLESASTINGKVPRTSSVKNTEEVVLNAATDSRLTKFLQSNKLRLELFLETDKEGNVPVVFYTYYGLKFNLALDGKFLYSGRVSDF